MSAVATSTITLIFGCDHVAHVTSGDRLPDRCPACFPRADEEPANLPVGLDVWEVVDGAVQTCAIFTSRDRAERWIDQANTERGYPSYSLVQGAPTVLDHPND